MDKQKFEEARRKIITFDERERHGIGMQMEKTLHAVLKYYEDPDDDHQEIPIENYIADIYTGSEIIEIQNGNFYKMRGKLDTFLPLYPVKIVYPIPHVKYVTWIDPETGALGKKNKSPKKGSFYDAFRELYRIRPYLGKTNLTIDLMLIDMDEYRLQDGWGSNGKRGSHRYDRIPKELIDELVLSSPADYLAFLPYDLPDEFSSGDVAKAAGRRPDGFSTVLQILTGLGVVERTGQKRGRAYLYRISEKYSDSR